jgi:hypothetical protein
VISKLSPLTSISPLVLPLTMARSASMRSTLPCFDLISIFLKARTVARYGKALDALDRGKKKVAMKRLAAITTDEPGFKPAAEDLRVLLR